MVAAGEVLAAVVCNNTPSVGGPVEEMIAAEEMEELMEFEVIVGKTSIKLFVLIGRSITGELVCMGIMGGSGVGLECVRRVDSPCRVVDSCGTVGAGVGLCSAVWKNKICQSDAYLDVYALWYPVVSIQNKHLRLECIHGIDACTYIITTQD